MIRPERGIALLEVLIALALLSVGGLATVGLIDESIRAQAEMAAHEQDTAVGGRVLAALSLLQGADLAQRLGKRELGEFILNVSRPEPTLFRIALSEARAPEQEILVTVVYRP
ncbi:MAG TPA: prepilin-type N-terminal cleavage/methylation domain-containing protein [Gemmatimonadales bacterium]|nr:prepilin-type N-terminal cleavage/methylation domain-containing protein [Gemmatimonadales bacterium]